MTRAFFGVSTSSAFTSKARLAPIKPSPKFDEITQSSSLDRVRNQYGANTDRVKLCPRTGHLISIGMLVVGNADVGGGEGAARSSCPPPATKMAELVRQSEAGSIDSLFRSSSSLFASMASLVESEGNSGSTDWI